MGAPLGWWYVLGAAHPILMLQSRSERTDIATLLIPSITVADGGIYLCVGTSAAGTARASIEVVVVPGEG